MQLREQDITDIIISTVAHIKFHSYLYCGVFCGIFGLAVGYLKTGQQNVWVLDFLLSGEDGGSKYLFCTNRKTVFGFRCRNSAYYES